MNFKAIFCAHNRNYEKITMPDGVEKTRKFCSKCGKDKVFCNHDYALLSKTHRPPIIDAKNIESISNGALDELPKLACGLTEFLFKCKKCHGFIKKSLSGEELINISDSGKEYAPDWKN